MGEVKYVAVSEKPIDAAALAKMVEDVRYGGVVTFTGQVRAVTGDVETSNLIYEAHETMALNQMAKIASEAAIRWDAKIAVAHRIGMLMPGDIAVICVAACGHRAEAFECCKYLIDRIKEDVPIWKKEFGPSGEAWMSDGKRIH